MLDGELVIRDADGNLEFDALQSRIHPAESRINLLAKEIPAGYVAFDLLAEGDESLLDAPLRERRERLEALASGQRPDADAADRATPSRPRSGCGRPRGRWRSSSTPPTSPASARGWRR